MDKDSKQVVVLLTHPNIKESRANKALMDAISDMGEVAIYNLYEMRVEDAFNAEIWSTIISHASALVFQFPFYFRILYQESGQNSNSLLSFPDYLMPFSSSILKSSLSIPTSSSVRASLWSFR